jgi:hypothetical protein
MSAQRIKSHRSKNLLLVAVSIVISFVVLRTPFFNDILLQLGNYGYIGSFIAGILFVSTFTIAPASVILGELSLTLSPYLLAILGGFGAMISNLLMIKAEDDLLEDLKPFYYRLGGKRISHFLHSNHFKWTLPVIGAIIIASPFPDEIGISLMELSGLKKGKFAVISFLLNAIGIFLLVEMVSLLR